MHTLDPTPASFLFERAPGKIRPCLVEKSRLLPGIRCDDHDRSRVGHISEALFAFPQGVLCLSMLLYQHRERHEWNADNNQKKLNGKNTVGVIKYEDRSARGSRCYRKQAHYRQRTGRT